MLSTCTLLLLPLALGAAPPNDRFEARAELAGLEGDLATSNREATSEPGDPFFPGSSGHTLWWRWAPGASGVATMHTLGSSFDTILGVYTWDGLSFAQVAHNDDDEHDSLQSALTFTSLANVEYAVRVDGLGGASGSISLTWHLDVASVPLAGDDFAARLDLAGESGRQFGSTRRATSEPGEPRHAARSSERSLWWRWVAPENGTLSLDTGGSVIDTVLAVYTGTAVNRLRFVAGDDDSGPGLASALALDVEAGVEQAIAMDGLDGESGFVALRWRFVPRCGPPGPPGDPFPVEGATRTSRNPVLRWGAPGEPRRNVIYGADDRLEIHEVQDPALVTAWRSTAALLRMPLDAVEQPDGSYLLNPLTYGEAQMLCPGERFAGQPAPASCSAFLVAPDLIVTAGHCVEGGIDCADMLVLFDFGLTRPGEVPLRAPREVAYRCAGMEGFSLGPGEFDPDWALVRLDRPVLDREPLRIRREGKIPNAQEVVVIGHPGGLPAKVSAGARVRDNSRAAGFVANLDTFGGNSGSAVLNADTLLVEGILVGGETDFTIDGACYRELRCPDTSCKGELSNRTTLFDHLVPVVGDLEYEVHLGPCDALALAGTTSDESFATGLLQPGTSYCWQIVARSECGVTKGPIWTFTTGDAVAPRFARGDVNGDGRLDITDPIVALGYLFQSAEEPGCLSSVDADDTGKIDLTDAIYLLQHLFQGGPPPPSPGRACGDDPTPDALPCRGPHGC